MDRSWWKCTEAAENAAFGWQGYGDCFLGCAWYMVCAKSNVSDFIVKQLYVRAHLGRLASVKGEVSS